MIRSITLRKADKKGGFKSKSFKIDDKEVHTLHSGMTVTLTVMSPEGAQSITLPAYKLVDMIEEVSAN
jgi:hypothetical protein